MLPRFPKSKFRAPALPAHYLPRERLLTVLNGNAAGRLTCLAAGAGYGKSTLAAGFLQRVPDLFVWINLDADDAGGAVFLQLILSGLAGVLPSFGAVLEREGVLHQAHWPGRGRLLDIAAEVLEDELAGRRLLLVLEDYQQVAGCPEAGALLDSLLKLLPSPVHLLVLSRRPVHLPSLPALTAAGRAAVLGREELAFTRDEAGRFFAARPGVPVPNALIEQVWRGMAGWPLGVQLAARAMAAGGAYSGPDTGVASLMEEVLRGVIAAEPPAVRDALPLTAVFEEWDGELFNAVFSRPDGCALAAHLSGSGLPVERLPGGGLRYHRTFKAFLLKLLKEDGQKYRDTQSRAADYFLARESPAEAFPCLVAAGERGRAVLALQQAARPLLRQGRLPTLGAMLETLPGPVLDTLPGIILDFGEACIHAGRFRDGLAWLRHAAGAFGAAGDAAGLTRALCAQGAAYAARGERENALAVYNQALGEAAAQNSLLRSVVLHYLAVWTARAGEKERPEKFFRAAAECCREHGDPAATAALLLDQAYFYYYRRGLFQEARALVERAALAAATAGDRMLTSRSRLVGGAVLLRLGRTAEALENFLLAAGECPEGKEDFPAGVPALLGAAEALSRLPDPDWPRIGELYDRAATALAAQEPFLEAAVLLSLGRSAFYRRRGDMVPALEEAGNALELAAGTGDCWLEAVAGLNQAAAYIQTGGEIAAGAPALLEKAAAAFTLVGDGYHLALIDCWRYYDRICRNGGADRRLGEKCLSHCGRFPALLPGEKALAESIPARPADAGGEKPAKPPENQPAGGGGKAGPPVTATAASPPLLRICCLGRFQVYRGGVLLDERLWRRRKAKTLLKYLALHREGKAPRDVIMELLWPDLPADKAANALYVTLHALRKALNRSLPVEVEYVAVKDGMIYLEPELLAEVDCRLFEEACARAFGRGEDGSGGAAADLERARRLYRGDLLAEDIYEDWPAAARERLRQLYLQVLTALASRALAAGREGEALDLWREAVEREPLDEKARAQLVRLLLRLGQRAAARRHLQQIRELLRRELGIKPGDELTALSRLC
ncbi:BTAD domain-containing putative transcriptional regulator [Desulfotomaculum copahuensis]|uniref:Bacterial transcriptional activator domain-containing protein n=1 Tax=Desulfotomaculum copahuensis TaxID=1838280 RepID=A0A1B7LCC6_9FIRM|nr:BTAD domain-containing putative transcriptional regulator [Desulfotomaculum copahuensis]OAT80362.1 hypothetical protein A6M21_13405 [Desulfotomaculum copahuensis]